MYELALLTVIMVASPFSIPLVAINAAFAAGACWHAVRGTTDRNARCSAVVLAVSFAISAMATPFILSSTGTTRAGEDFLFNIGTVVFSSLLLALIAIVYREQRRCERNPAEREARSYEAFLARLVGKNDISRDTSRKALHVVLSGSTVAIHLIVLAVDEWFTANDMFQEIGVSGLGAARSISLLVFWGFSYLISMQDLVRLRAFHCIPGWGRRWLRASLETKEHRGFTAAVPFLLGHVPLLLAPLPVFFSVSFCASLGDAAASMVGKRFGRRQISTRSPKTWEGAMAGTIIALACATGWMLAFHPAWVGFTFGITIATIFALADACNGGWIDDNFVNTFLLGAVAWLLHAGLLALA